MLEEAHDRLSGVVIECLPYDAMIRRYDTPSTLFYLDPPYHGSEGDYGPNAFSTADYEALSDLLSAIKGSFILSINDTPLMRETFARFDIEEVALNYRISGGATPARELIISGGCPTPVL